jgi:hypothetical protein
MCLTLQRGANKINHSTRERSRQDPVEKTLSAFADCKDNRIQQQIVFLLSYLCHDQVLGLLERRTVGFHVVSYGQGLEQVLGPQVAGHDDHRVGEVDGTALPVRQPAIVQNLAERREPSVFLTMVVERSWLRAMSRTAKAQLLSITKVFRCRDWRKHRNPTTMKFMQSIKSP